MNSVSSPQSRLAQLRERFMARLPGQVGELRSDLASGMCLEEMHLKFHTLRGGSASFGLNGLAALAAEADVLLMSALDTGQDVDWRPRLEVILDRIEVELAQDGSPAAPDSSPGLFVAAGKPRDGQRRRIYFCEDDPDLCRSLAAQIECFGFEVTGFVDLEAFHEAVAKRLPDAVVMDLMHPGQPTGGADMMQKLRTTWQIPTVYLTCKGDLASRLAAVRAGSDAYFQKPVAVQDLCATLTRLTCPEEVEPYRILVVDDDRTLSTMYATLLQGAGMETRVLNDPLEALPVLEEFKPDLLLMDLHMPGCNGMDLAKAIRQIHAYLSLPILFLSAETDVDRQFDARRMGADEFLTKPIRPEHLISAVQVRAERMKLIRSFLVRDGMTGLYNHTTFLELLDVNLDRARRQGTELCLAMLDMDHFKRINDHHGHPVGDRVLIALAGLLRRRLRKSDLVGRWGGEEFAILFPDCSLAHAAACLDQLRESFSSLGFPAGGEDLKVTFSAGVASNRMAPDAESLCEAADAALYWAKRDGRNLVRAVP
jgi:diguanylate cyclase (GGDEF)-like protein